MGRSLQLIATNEPRYLELHVKQSVLRGIPNQTLDANLKQHRLSLRDPSCAVLRSQVRIDRETSRVVLPLLLPLLPKGFESG